MILVTGATGTVGSEVARLLSGGDLRVKAMVHSLEKAGPLRLLKVELVGADLRDPRSLEAALDGVDTVYLVGPSTPDQPQLEANMIDACRRAGVRYVVRQSALGADPEARADFCRMHGEIEQHLAQSGLAHTNLRPNYFMQSLLPFAATVAGGGEIALPAEGASISMIDARDIAHVGAHCLTEQGHEGKAYALTGPEAISMPEVAGKLAAAAGRPVRRVSVPGEQALQSMVAMGIPNWFAAGVLAPEEVWAGAAAEAVTDDVERVTGRRARSFDDFARDYAPVFRQAEAA